MKNILLKAVCIAAIALPFSAQMAKAATVTANLSDVTNSNTQNYPTVKITLSDDGQPAGTIKVIATVVNGATGGTADLRGIYFNLPSGVTNATITRTGGGPITAVEGAANSFGTIGNSADLQGAKVDGKQVVFGIGIEVGSQGIGGTPPDDFQSVEFTVSANGLTLAGFANAKFGSRMMSVSESAGGPRTESSKTLGNGGTVVTPPSPSPSPSTSPSPSPSPSTSPSPSPSPSTSPSPSPSTSPSPSPSPSTPTGGGGGGGGTPSPSPSPSVPTGGGGGGGGGTPDVAEPITILGMGLGLGGLLLSRRNRNKNK